MYLATLHPLLLWISRVRPSGAGGSRVCSSPLTTTITRHLIVGQNGDWRCSLLDHTAVAVGTGPCVSQWTGGWCSCFHFRGRLLPLLRASAKNVLVARFDTHTLSPSLVEPHRNLTSHWGLIASRLSVCTMDLMTNVNDCHAPLSLPSE